MNSSLQEDVIAQKFEVSLMISKEVVYFYSIPYLLFSIQLTGSLANKLLASLRAGSHLKSHARVAKRGDPAGRSLVKRCQESEPALMSVIFLLLLRLSEMKYHWSKSGKGVYTVNLLCLMRSD